jgi:hypothetical protein
MDREPFHFQRNGWMDQLTGKFIDSFDRPISQSHNPNCPCHKWENASVVVVVVARERERERERESEL